MDLGPDCCNLRTYRDASLWSCCGFAGLSIIFYIVDILRPKPDLKELQEINDKKPKKSKYQYSASSSDNGDDNYKTIKRLYLSGSSDTDLRVGFPIYKDVTTLRCAYIMNFNGVWEHITVTPSYPPELRAIISNDTIIQIIKKLMPHFNDYIIYWVSIDDFDALFNIIIEWANYNHVDLTGQSRGERTPHDIYITLCIERKVFFEDPSSHIKSIRAQDLYT